MPRQDVLIVTVRRAALGLRLQLVHVDLVDLGLSLALRLVLAALGRGRLRLPVRLLRGGLLAGVSWLF